MPGRRACLCRAVGRDFGAHFNSAMKWVAGPLMVSYGVVAEFGQAEQVVSSATEDE